MTAPVETTTSTRPQSTRSLRTLRSPAAMSGPASPSKIVGRLRSVSAFSQTSRARPRFRAWIELSRNWSSSPPMLPARVTSTGRTGSRRNWDLRTAPLGDTSDHPVPPINGSRRTRPGGPAGRPPARPSAQGTGQARDPSIDDRPGAHDEEDDHDRPVERASRDAGPDPGPDEATQGRDQDEGHRAGPEDDPHPEIGHQDDLEDHRGVPQLEQENQEKSPGNRGVGRGGRRRPFHAIQMDHEVEGVGDEDRSAPRTDLFQVAGAQEAQQERPDPNGDCRNRHERQAGPDPGFQRIVTRGVDNQAQVAPIDQLEPTDQREDRDHPEELGRTQGAS